MICLVFYARQLFSIFDFFVSPSIVLFDITNSICSRLFESFAVLKYLTAKAGPNFSVNDINRFVFCVFVQSGNISARSFLLSPDVAHNNLFTVDGLFAIDSNITG